MVKDVTLEIEPLDDVTDKEVQANTVYVDDDRILTMTSESDSVLTKWIKSAEKTQNNTKKPNTVVVTLIAEKNNCGPSERNDADKPYDLLTFSVGSSCFMFKLTDHYGNAPQSQADAQACSPKALRDFLESKRVTVVGVGIADVAKKLDKVHGLKIREAVDLRDVAMTQGVVGNDIEGLSKGILGMNYPANKKVIWHYRRGTYNTNYGPFSEDKIKYVTAQSFFMFQIAANLFGGGVAAAGATGAASGASAAAAAAGGGGGSKKEWKKKKFPSPEKLGPSLNPFPKLGPSLLLARDLLQGHGDSKVTVTESGKKYIAESDTNKVQSSSISVEAVDFQMANNNVNVLDKHWVILY
ncbi:hypothetical protein ACFE04_031544 [Oxalis oulophora]